MKSGRKWKLKKRQEERKAREDEERKAREEEERKAREAEKESQEEMMARIREEVRKEMEAEKAAAAIAAIPVPPSPTLSSKSTNREAVPSNAPSNATTTPRKEEPKVIQPQVSINEVKQVQLKPVNRVQETPDRHDNDEEEEPRPVRMSVRDRMAMFGGAKPRYTPTPAKVDAPVVNGNVNGLEKVTEAVVKSPNVTSPTKKKKPFTFGAANQMSFKIVESTPTIN